MPTQRRSLKLQAETFDRLRTLKREDETWDDTMHRLADAAERAESDDAEAIDALAEAVAARVDTTGE